MTWLELTDRDHNSYMQLYYESLTSVKTFLSVAWGPMEKYPSWSPVSTPDVHELLHTMKVL